jgi:hypothetical protein
MICVQRRLTAGWACAGPLSGRMDILRLTTVASVRTILPSVADRRMRGVCRFPGPPLWSKEAISSVEPQCSPSTISVLITTCGYCGRADNQNPGEPGDVGGPSYLNNSPLPGAESVSGEAHDWKSSRRAGCHPGGCRHHERHARRLSERTRAGAQYCDGRRSTGRRSKARTPGTMPAPATPRIASSTTRRSGATAASTSPRRSTSTWSSIYRGSSGPIW